MENIKKYKFLYRQENLQYLYESAIKRMEAHPEYAEKRKSAYSYANQFSWENNTKIFDDILTEITSVNK